MTIPVTAVRYARGSDLESLADSVAAAISAGFTVAIAAPTEVGGHLVQAMGTPADTPEPQVIVSEDEGNQITRGTDGGAFLAAE